MIKLLKPKVTVEQIHAEFDSAEERLRRQAEEILSNLEIPTETAIERKAKLAEELGFVNSEVVVKAKSIFERNKTIQRTLDMTRSQADTLEELKFHYPNEKFLNVEELDRICEKYGLIHCPIVNYIKDIPEKNLVEIKNKKPLRYEHAYKQTVIVSDLNDLGEVLLKVLGKEENPSFTYEEADKLNRYWITNNSGTYSITPDNWTNGDDWFTIGGQYFLRSIGKSPDSYPRYDKKTIVKKDGLFIAAPNSHFDTKGLSQKGKFGWFNVQTVEVKDPVVFEYCKNGFIRIITKWGTDDDQSYLDPALFNEKLN